MPIHIIAAAYGTKTNGNDVTKIVQTMVNPGNDDITIDNHSMGGDPDVGTKKQFGIVYKLENGQIRARAANEGDTIDLA